MASGNETITDNATRTPYNREDFAYGAGAMLKQAHPGPKDFPFWEVIGRFYDIDGYCRKYELRWTDPVDWTMDFQVVTESTALTHFEDVDPEVARTKYSKYRRENE